MWLQKSKKWNRSLKSITIRNKISYTNTPMKNLLQIVLFAFLVNIILTQDVSTDESILDIATAFLIQNDTLDSFDNAPPESLQNAILYSFDNATFDSFNDAKFGSIQNSILEIPGEPIILDNLVPQVSLEDKPVSFTGEPIILDNPVPQEAIEDEPVTFKMWSKICWTY